MSAFQEGCCIRVTSSLPPPPSLQTSLARSSNSSPCSRFAFRTLLCGCSSRRSMFSTRELNARAQKLEAEQRARTEREKARLEKDRIIAERGRQRELEREEQQRLRKLEEQQREAAERERVYQATEQNRGVYLSVQLAALPADEAEINARGIRRSKDKVLLPPSVGESLMNQGAGEKNGAMLFELRLPGSSGPEGCTHAGVFAFTAPEGTVLLPRKVVQSLWGSLDAQPAGNVVITYKRLEKGTYVRMQPMCHGFHERMGDSMREVLESTLMGHSTLTEGDWLTLQHAGEDITLRVQELQPGCAVSIIDTDIEADVVPSLESEQYLAQWEEQQRQHAARLAQLAAERAAHEQAEAERLRQQQAELAAQAAADAERRDRARALKAAALPPEPPSDAAEPYVTCLLRLPDGGRVSRRVLLAQPLQLLFDVADSQGAGGLEPGSYALVTRFPRRVLSAESAAGGCSVGEVGLTAGAQEALFVEPLDGAVAAGGGAGDGGPGQEGAAVASR